MVGKVIVGLGNPGTQYARSRHNVGFLCLDRLASLHRLSFNQRYAHSDVATGRIDGVEAVLAKPRTYMNLSGNAVLGLLARHRVKPADLIVIYDDMDLPLGKIRLRGSGSAGGHKGMLSIIGCIGTQEFTRIRVGIGRPGEIAMEDGTEGRGAIHHVLGPFRPDELPVLEEALERAIEALGVVLSRGLVAAMNVFNA